jgi:hypothetical protein
MKFDYPTRIKTSALLLLFLNALLINLSYFNDIRKFASTRVARDELSVNDRRFEKIRHSLPQGGVVGYVADPLQAEPGKEYYLAQYALTPSVVVQGAGPELIIGNFTRAETRAETSQRILAEHNLRLIKDYGNGIMLFGRQ